MKIRRRLHSLWRFSICKTASTTPSSTAGQRHSTDGEEAVHRADAVHEHFHDVGGEERILLDEALKAALIHLGQPAGCGRHNGRAAHGIIH